MDCKHDDRQHVHILRLLAKIRVRNIAIGLSIGILSSSLWSYNVRTWEDHKRDPAQWFSSTRNIALLNSNCHWSQQALEVEAKKSIAERAITLHYDKVNPESCKIATEIAVADGKWYVRWIDQNYRCEAMRQLGETLYKRRTNQSADPAYIYTNGTVKFGVQE